MRYSEGTLQGSVADAIVTLEDAALQISELRSAIHRIKLARPDLSHAQSDRLTNILSQLPYFETLIDGELGLLRVSDNPGAPWTISSMIHPIVGQIHLLAAPIMTIDRELARS